VLPLVRFCLVNYMAQYYTVIRSNPQIMELPTMTMVFKLKVAAKMTVSKTTRTKIPMATTKAVSMIMKWHTNLHAKQSIFAYPTSKLDLYSTTGLVTFGSPILARVPSHIFWQPRGCIPGTRMRLLYCYR
jgi:hypothetical protein